MCQLVRLIVLGDDVSQSCILTIPILPLLLSVIFFVAAFNIVS